MISPSLRQEISQLEANFCFALSDPIRILTLYTLKQGPHNVSELTDELGVSQPTTSRHLKVLRDRGLVQATRRGTNITYSLSDGRLIQALDLLRAVMHEQLDHQASLMHEIAEGVHA